MAKLKGCHHLLNTAFAEMEMDEEIIAYLTRKQLLSDGIGATKKRRRSRLGCGFSYPHIQQEIHGVSIAVTITHNIRNQPMMQQASRASMPYVRFYR